MNRYKLLHFEELTSTNEYAKRYGRNNEVIVAKRQTGGKGRLGRSWSTEEGEAIAMSICLVPKVDVSAVSMLTLVAAMAVREALSEHEVMIKWPNDIIYNNKKLAGILTEMITEDNRIKTVVIGIGLNVNVCEFPQDIRNKATSMYLETGKTYDMQKIIDDILLSFAKYYDIFLKTSDMKLLKEEYNNSLINYNRLVKAISSGEKMTGTALGIDDDGELVIRKNDGTIISIRSGEVSVRGIDGYV